MLNFVVVLFLYYFLFASDYFYRWIDRYSDCIIYFLAVTIAFIVDISENYLCLILKIIG